jgi:natural product biosynthesis luciferase-like monooxygenase protein
MAFLQVVESFALAPMQQGMLFDDLAATHPGSNIEQIVCTLGEPISTPELTRAWALAADRHAALRTSYHWDSQAVPLQNVHAEAPISLTEMDLTQLDASRQAAAIDDFLARDRARGFALDTPPLWRVTLIRLGPESYVAVWTFHHILMDGGSFPLVLRDVFDSYDRLISGHPPALAPTTSFRLHVEHVQAALSDREPARSFWRARLDGFDTPTPLPAALVATSAMTPAAEGAPATVRATLDADTTAALHRLAERSGASIANIFQAAWALLLSRTSGQTDVLFGTTRAGRRSSIAEADRIAGVFINTVPTRVRIDETQSVSAWLGALRMQQSEVWRHEQLPLAEIQALSDMPAGVPLFDSVVVFDPFDLDAELRRPGGRWQNRHFELIEKPPIGLTIYAALEATLALKIAYDARRFEGTAVERTLGHLRTILTSLAAGPDQRVGDVAMLSAEEQRTILGIWNATQGAFEDTCIQTLVTRQVARTPDAPALSYGETTLTYAELDARANRLAHVLVCKGIGPDKPVGICLARGPEMVIAMLAVWKAGGAYVPIDPTYPADRIGFMLEDSQATVVITEGAVVGSLRTVGGGSVRHILVDQEADAIARQDTAEPVSHATSSHLAYIIYTSGSTGRPKGVMVTHRNVANFFAGMDTYVTPSPGAVWLAVTSMSFDISVLELLYTLTRGFHVVLQHDGRPRAAGSTKAAAPQANRIDFGLFYFAADADAGEGADTQGNGRYRLLIEGAKFADAHGFSSISVPERHFHAFGGLYPNPAIAAAALAMVTSRIQIRAGSVVMPLHHPARVAEDWSMVDNLSGGRIAVSLASGWQPVDFVLQPDAYADRHRLLYDRLDIVQRLWRGEAVPFRDASGNEHLVGTLPRPLQSELPVWITTAGSRATWVEAGRRGLNVLSHLLGQSRSDLAANIAAYRRARTEAGHDPAAGRVTLMLHTYIGEDVESVRAIVREPMKRYLRTALSLVGPFVSSWSAFKRSTDHNTTIAADVDPSSLTAQELDELLEFSFARYFETSGLFGTPQSCLAMVDDLHGLGVNEIACLVDFGIETEAVLAALPRLDALRQLSAARADARLAAEPTSALILRTGATHLQCTPTAAALLLAEPRSKEALARLRTLMIGGEAFPPTLAQELKAATSARVLNMYGPTETTIWSTVATVDAGTVPIPIGRPILNTEVYVVDGVGRPLPIGVPGRLLIGGAGVARGYHARPDLTAERFIAHPLAERRGERVYDTGDLARWRADGMLEFLGRADHQVKVRGYRIELGEIETRLAAHASVRQAVVVAREDVPGDVRLVAYVVPATGTNVDTNALRAHVAAALPEFMVPSAVVALASLPMTPNRKIDRKALPPPGVSSPVQTAAGAAAAPALPVGEAESRVAAIWKDVLRIDSVGATDNFFDLGGHSLLAVKLHRRLEDAFARELTLVDIFRYPTVRALAGLLESGSAADDSLDRSERRAMSRRSLARQRARARETTH